MSSTGAEAASGPAGDGPAGGVASPPGAPATPEVKQDAAPEKTTPVEPEEKPDGQRTEPAGDKDDSASAMPSDEDICAQARHILSEANLDEMTAKQLRNKLSEHFGVDLKPKKKIISAEIDRFVAEQAGNDDDQDEAAEPPAKKRRGWGGGKDTRFGSLLSPEMQEFLGVERMDKRTVTKKIWEYIKEKDLQYPKDRRKVVLDDKLKTIFKGTPAGMISMLKMPAQISRHVKIEDFVAD